MRGLIYLAAYFAALFLAHFFVKALMRRFRPPEAEGVQGAGALIGFLERGLVLTFVLLNQYTAIGLILTAKSIARYKELDNRRFAEYFLIGTLSSVLFAILIGVIAKWLLTSSP
jgi:predicted permease